MGLEWTRTLWTSARDRPVHKTFQDHKGSQYLARGTCDNMYPQGKRVWSVTKKKRSLRVYSKTTKLIQKKITSSTKSPLDIISLV